MILISALFLFIRSLIISRTALAAENLSLRQQLAVLNRKIHRPKLYLFVDFGQAFTEEAARRYGHRDLERLMSKLLYFCLVDQIGTILDGKGLALKGEEDEAWLRLKQLLRRCPSGH